MGSKGCAGAVPNLIIIILYVILFYAGTGAVTNRGRKQRSMARRVALLGIRVKDRVRVRFRVRVSVRVRIRIHGSKHESN